MSSYSWNTAMEVTFVNRVTHDYTKHCNPEFLEQAITKTRYCFDFSTVDSFMELLSDDDFNHIGTDPDVVEISTHNYNNREQLFEAIAVLYRTARRLKVKPSTVYSAGGGSHIHIDAVAWENQIIDFIFNNQAIVYAFSPYTMYEMGIINPMSIYSSRHINRIKDPDIAEWLWAENASRDSRDDYALGISKNLKINSMRSTYFDTLEFRFLRAAENLREVKDFVALVDHITDFCKDQPHVDFAYKTFRPYKNVEDCLASFKTAMGLIGLPSFYNKYKKGILNRYRFVEENPQKNYLVLL